MSHPIDRLRVVALLEGVSYLVLLGIAMPMKYMAGIEEAVRYVGWAHGILFMLFVAAVVQVAAVRRWHIQRTLWALVASVVPFGTFVLDVHLRRERLGATSPVASNG